MKNIDLSKEVELDEKEGVWFPYSYEPHYKGFQIKLRLLSPREMNKLRKRCIEIKRGREIFDEDKFFLLTTQEIFVDFKGLTFVMLRRLVPTIKRIQSIEGKEVKENEEIAFSPQNAFFLRENSYGIINFLNEKILESEEFYYQQQEAEAKN